MTRVTLAPSVRAAVDEIAERRGLTRRQTVELAVGFLQTAEQARLAGLHVGATADREALERLIVARAAA